MVKTRVLVIILLVVVAVSVALCLVFFLPGSGKTGGTANVFVEGELVWSVDLAAVTEPLTYEVKTPYGTNVLQVEKGRIRVLDADCKDRVCVESGWRSAGGAPIVCLPHKLVVTIDTNGDVDAVSA